jgi:hypothetical protein
MSDSELSLFSNNLQQECKILNSNSVTVLHHV